MIEQAIYTILTGHAGLSALIGDRAYPVILPQGTTLPAITFKRNDTSREYSHDGFSGLATPTFEITVWEPKPLTAKQIAAQVRAAMNAARRTTVAGVAIGSVTCEDERDAYDQESREVGVQLDFDISHSE